MDTLQNHSNPIYHMIHIPSPPTSSTHTYSKPALMPKTTQYTTPTSIEYTRI